MQSLLCQPGRREMKNPAAVCTCAPGWLINNKDMALAIGTVPILADK